MSELVEAGDRRETAAAPPVGERRSHRSFTERRQAELLLAGEKQALEMIASNAPLEEILDAVNAMIEARLPETLSSIHLLDDGRLRHASAPSLPAAYNAAIDGVAVGPAVGSCGTAAHFGRQVTVADIASDPLWADYRDLASEHSLRACWSTPILSSNREVLGTFALYYRERREPTAADFEVMERMTHLAGIAIERRRADDAARELADQLRFQATHDALTGLYNRYELERRLRHLLDDARRRRGEHALCYLDLDQFKIINDSCGHVAGDELLRQLAGQLQSSVFERDMLARLGGDEFGVLLEDCSLARAKKVADTLRRTIEDFRFRWDGRGFSIGVSIGLVPIVESSDSVTGILRAADSACYVAKDEGRNRIHTYRPDDEELLRRSGEMRWVNRIRLALEEDRFRLDVQPIAAIRGPRRRGEHFEMLLRIEEDDASRTTPEAFLPAAERFHLATKLDRWVLGSACDWLASQKRHLERLHLCSLNLSGQSLGDKDFLRFVLRELEEKQIPPGKLCFEITETAAIANLSHATRFIRALRSLGCRFALDDFGTGFSSFGYLKSLPVDFLKIDGMFVVGVAEDRFDLAVIRSIVEIGQLMGKRTIAEFVESPVILRKLEQIGVDFAQGYAVGRPRPLEGATLAPGKAAPREQPDLAPPPGSVTAPRQLGLPY